MNTDEMVNELETISVTIDKFQRQLYLLKQQKDETTLVMKSIEKDIVREVNADIQYKNAAQRKDAIEEQLEKDETYLNRNAAHESAKKEVDDLVLNLEFVQNRFKSLRAIAYIIGGK